MMRWLGLLLLALLVVTSIGGCRRGRSRDGRSPLVSARYRRAQQQLEVGSGCEDIESLRAIRPGVLSARGCGERRELIVGPDLAVAHVIAPVETRAARELACPDHAIEVTAPSPTSRGVSGCGRRARYDLICDEPLTDCAWTMTAHAGDWAGSALAVAPVVPASYAPDTSLDEVALPPPPTESVLPAD